MPKICMHSINQEKCNKDSCKEGLVVLVLELELELELELAPVVS